MNAYGLDVSAPTGHRSMTFPDSSELKSFSTYVPTCMSPPRPVVPRSSTPATSLANLQTTIVICVTQGTHQSCFCSFNEANFPNSFKDHDGGQETTSSCLQLASVSVLKDKQCSQVSCESNKPDASCAVDATGHDGFHEWPDVLVLHGSLSAERVVRKATSVRPENH